MRPEDLKFPFTGNERYTFLSNRIWFIPWLPLDTDTFAFPGWSHPDIFGNDNPVCVEYCSGNGAWIAEKAVKFPMINWVAVEKKFVRARKIWSKIKNLELTNLIVICGEAQNATKLYFGDQTIEDIYINFPDPWPKSRHVKHRIIQKEFVQEMWRVLRDGQSLTFVTDDPPYSEWLIEIMGGNPGFVSQFPEPFFVTEQPNYGSSYFDELWRAKGRIIRYHQFKKLKM